MLDAQVILQSIGCVVACSLTDTGNAQTSTAKAVRGAGGKLVSIVKEPAIAISRSEAADEWGIDAGGPVGHEDVVPIVKLTEAAPDGPLARSCRVPCHAQARRKGSIEVVLYGSVRSLYSTRSCGTGIGTET